jgi:prophage regulatory protein
MPHLCSCPLIYSEEMAMTASVASRRTLRIRQVKKKVDISEATIWRLCASGKFPKPIKISKGCTVWLEHEIDQLLDAKAADREPAPSAQEGRRTS